MVLTARQRRFADLYALAPNATKAAIDTDYSSRTAYSQGSRLLRHEGVRRRVSEQGRALLAEARVDATDALRRLDAIAVDETTAPFVRLRASETILKVAGLLGPTTAVGS